jgi:hypothetical protein
MVFPQVPPSALACLIFQNSPNGIKRKKLAPIVPAYQSPIIPDEARWGEIAVITYVARGGITWDVARGGITWDDARDGITRDDARDGVTWKI